MAQYDYQRLEEKMAESFGILVSSMRLERDDAAIRAIEDLAILLDAESQRVGAHYPYAFNRSFQAARRSLDGFIDELKVHRLLTKVKTGIVAGGPDVELAKSKGYVFDSGGEVMLTVSGWERRLRMSSEIASGFDRGPLDTFMKDYRLTETANKRTPFDHSISSSHAPSAGSRPSVPPAPRYTIDNLEKLVDRMHEVESEAQSMLSDSVFVGANGVTCDPDDVEEIIRRCGDDFVEENYRDMESAFRKIRAARSSRVRFFELVDTYGRLYEKYASITGSRLPMPLVFREDYYTGRLKGTAKVDLD